MKAIVPGEFPERAFPVSYARKDLRYALALARESGVEASAAELVDRWFDRAIEAGDGERYHPVISRLIDGEERGG
jgi:3-hydroxyisobutyrate dehydrogenase-like beta-hydroxyacid dehydrogenase